MQDLSKFSLPKNFRGKNAIIVQLWWAIDCCLFKRSPQFMYKFRSYILKIFGAKVGKNVLIRPSATITYPWKLTIGDNSWIGDEAVIYNLGNIIIGENSVISQKTYLCAGDHDYNDPFFRIRSNEINIGDEVWIATDSFISPGVTINNGCVIGARSSVYKDMPAWQICYGSPCKPIKPRMKSLPSPDCS